MKRGQMLWRGVFLLAFTACVLYITLFCRTPSLARGIGTRVCREWYSWLVLGNQARGKEILENIAMFVPFGYLAAAFLDACSLGKKRANTLTLLLGCLLSLAVEALQYYGGRGATELKDVLHNTLGAGLGLLFFRLLEGVFAKKNSAGSALRFGALPVLMLLAGLLGCWQMKDSVMLLNQHTDQFWFSVDEVKGDSFSGRCYAYDRETPPWRLYLVSGAERIEAALSVEGDRYSAEAKRADDRQYELFVRFSGHVKLSSGVFLKGAAVEYVLGAPQLPGEAADLPPDAVLKACSEEYDCWVFQSGGELIWLVGESVAETTELVCHVMTSEPEKLPQQRICYGFDNRGFCAGEPDRTLGAYRCYVRAIPTEYPVSAITVGLNPGGAVVWCASFRM